MNYKIESVEKINDFTVTNYVPEHIEPNIQKHIIMTLYNIFASDSDCVDIKVKSAL